MPASSSVDLLGNTVDRQRREFRNSVLPVKRAALVTGARFPSSINKSVSLSLPSVLAAQAALPDIDVSIDINITIPTDEDSEIARDGV